MREYLLGNVAIAKGLFEADAGLVAGYPGTPSSEIIESVVHLKGKNPIHVEWSVNEKVAMEVAIGASWTGTRSAVTMKHVGLNVAADPFMTLAYLGVGAGLVVISADDPFCHSSQNEQDSRRYAQFASVPCLDPADPQEAKEMTVFGFDLSERLDLPVLLRSTTRISHARADVELREASQSQRKREFVKNPARRVALPIHVRPLHSKLIKKQKAVMEALEDSPWNRLELRGEHGVIASGIASLYAEEAMKDLELNLSFLKIVTVPAPFELIRKLLRQVNKVLVVEELEPILEEQVERIALKVNPEVEILGKDDYFRKEGELDLFTVRNAISAMEELPIKSYQQIPETDINLPPRPPALCPGCSHRATYFAMIKAFGKDAIFPSDIGCYTMAVNMGTVDTCLCMGASITLATGIRFGGETRDICCSLGDSTFLHGGLTGLLNAVYNKAHITITILDNGTTAMTGHQPHPGTGLMATGEQTTQISLEAISKALGAGFVQTINPYDFQETVEMFKRAK
ncbi:MAG: indolepyruvate ferredoxin oxidoreductase subunit alpha [Methanotrichaceae archaeon]|nr:indolepyruvate ferredoxin oxidoreductase subunit alpha [Methanotrichaceae archaeon]